MNVLSTVANNTFWNALNTVGGLLLGLTTSILLARLLGPTALGQYRYWVWLMGIFHLLASLSVPYAMTKFGAEYLGHHDRQTASALFIWLLLAELTLGILVGGAVLLYTWTVQTADPIALTIIGLSIVPLVLEGLFLAAMKGSQNFRILSQANLVGAGVYAVAAITAVSLGFGIHALLLIFLVRHLITLVWMGWKLPSFYMMRKPKHEGNDVREVLSRLPSRLYIPPALRRRLLLYCRDVLLILVIDIFRYRQSEIEFLRRFSSDADIAFYSQAFDLAFNSMAIPAIFSGILLPTFSALSGQKDRAQRNDLYLSSNRIVALIAVPIGFGGAAIAPALAALYGPAFLAMAPILAVLCVGNVVGSMASVSNATLHSIEKQSFNVRWGLLMAVVNIALNFLLIPSYGGIGAAVAHSSSQVISGIVGITYTFQCLHVSFPRRAFGRIALAALLAAAVAGLISSWIVYWGGLLLAIGAAIIVYPVLLRWSRALEAADLALLSQFSHVLPKGLIPTYRTLLHWLVRV